MQIIIKYFTIIFCTWIVCIKIFGADIKRKHLVSFILFSILLSIPTFYINIYEATIIPLYITIISSIFIAFYLKKFILHICIVSIISLSISYILLILSSTITGIILISFIDINYYSHILVQILAAIFQITFTYFLTKIPRIRGGIPFIVHSSNSLFLLFGSILTLIGCTILSNGSYELVKLIPYFLTFIATLFFCGFIQQQFRQTYLLKINQRDNIALQHTLEQVQAENAALKSEVKTLTHIIHEDNKLIPALESAVNSFINLNQFEKDKYTNSSSLSNNKLLQALANQSKMRQIDIQSADKVLYTNIDTGISSINILLQYYYQRSIQEDIHFSCHSDKQLCLLKQHGYDEHELTVIIADLLENAFYAVKDISPKNVLLTISTIDSKVVLDIYDNGNLFSKEILIKMGMEEYTSHKEDGGSGIGLMNLYQFIHSHHVSYMLHELSDTESDIYTKKISLFFNDSNSGYMIFKTFRTDLTQKLSATNPNWIISL